MTTPTSKTIGDYLIERLHHYGVEHVFGIPGDFCIMFYHQMQASGLIIPINTADEQGSGFAADGYARLRGLGVNCQTYGVGGVKALHTTASAYAEHVPVVVISGAPGVRERVRGPILHHTIREFDTQMRMYREVTVASTCLDDPQTAFAEIDRVLSAALHHKRPVYIELPRDMTVTPGDQNHVPSDYYRPASNPHALAAALAEMVKRINVAKQPVILAGVEIQRYGQKDKLRQLLDSTNIPFATTVLGKGVVGESHPRFIGVYQGTIGLKDTTEYVEASDCVISLGTILTDINLGLFTTKYDPFRDIFVNQQFAKVGGQNYEAVRLEDVIDALIDANLPRSTATNLPEPLIPTPFEPIPETPIKSGRLFEAINAFLTDSTPICGDNGEPLIAGLDLLTTGDESFYAPGYYTSVGFSVPMAMGIQLARPDLRPVVICGDGAFQMDGMEVSTMARYHLNPIIIVMDNGGYGSERPFFNEQYVDTQRWNYAKYPEVVGAGKGFTVTNEQELVDALTGAQAYTEDYVIIDVKLEHFDYSPAFARFLAKFTKG